MKKNTKKFVSFTKTMFGVMAVIGLGLTTSCSNDDDVTTPAQTEETGAINFTASVSGMKTRMTNNTWEEGDQVGIIIGDQTVPVPYYIKNTQTGEMASNDPNKYEYKENTEFTVNAFYPYPAVPYDLKDQSSEETRNNLDKLLVATATSTQKDVELQFTHALTKVEYEIQRYTGYTDADKAAATVTFLGYGSVNVTKGAWKGEGEPTAEIATNKTSDNNGWAYMAPAEMWEKPMFKIVIGGDTFIYTPKKSNDEDVKNDRGVLKAGHYQKYYIWVDKASLKAYVKVKSSNITEWIKDGFDKGGMNFEAPQD